MDGMRVQGGQGQTQTTARYKALTCIRMAVQQACMKEAYLGPLPDSEKWNVDASTMISQSQGKNSAMYRVVSCRQGDALEIADYASKLLKNPLTR